MSNESQRRWAMILVAVLAAIVALKFSHPVLAPLSLAFVVSVLLTPIRDFWCRFGVGLSGASVLTAFGALFVFGIIAVLLQPALQNLVDQWPSMKAELGSALTDLRQWVREFYNLQEEVMDAISPDGSAGGDASATATSAMPSLTDAALAAPQVAGQVLVFIGGVFFFLLCRADMYVWLAKFLNRNTDDAGWTEDDFTRADKTVSSYFATVAAINMAFGAAVAVALTVIGLPGAIIWGIVAALTNFVVYLGAAVTAALLLLAGTVSFDGWAVALPLAAFLALNFIEGQFVTPAIVGKRMDLNPLMVFVALTFSVWLWGAIGGIVAIPLIVWVMALVTHKDHQATLKRSEITEQPTTPAEALL